MLQHTTKSVRHLEKEGLRYKLGHCCKPSCVTDGRPSAVIDQKGNPSMYITKETSCSKEIESSLHEGAYQMFFSPAWSDAADKETAPVHHGHLGEITFPGPHAHKFLPRIFEQDHMMLQQDAAVYLTRGWWSSTQNNAFPTVDS